MGIFTLYAIGCLGGHEKPSGIVWTARAQDGTSLSHTSNIVRRRLAERVWWTKFQSSLLNICSRLSGFQTSLRLIYFRDGGVHCTKVWHKTYPICDAALSRSAGPAQLRPVTEIALPQPFLCVKRCPFWHDFGGGAKSIQYSPVADPGEGPTRAAPPPPLFLSGIILVVAQNLSSIVQGTGPRGPPPHPSLFLSGIILVVAQNLSGIVQWRIQGRGPGGPPPYFYLVSFWRWRKIYPV